MNHQNQQPEGRQLHAKGRVRQGMKAGYCITTEEMGCQCRESASLYLQTHIVKSKALTGQRGLDSFCIEQQQKMLFYLEKDLFKEF